ncbi:MAG TPA: hypothetical protein VFK14_03065 [Solirubrobacterales bacterium]|nr:hypothetical protein [Solirubrobacterales bacterium]
MKEHVLADSDRAALQSLVPLASAIGVGTMFALFFGPRKRTAYALFEIFAIVAVLVAAALTAATAISLMHRDAAISDHELTQTAMPLVVAGFLLVFIQVIARLRAAGDRTWTMLPVGLVLVYVAAMLTLRVWAATPGNASLVAAGLLAVGALLSFGVALWERRSARGSRRGRVAALARTVAEGYVPDRRPLLLSLPEAEGATPPRLHCWVKRGRTYLDLDGCRWLRGLVEARWDAVSAGEVQLPTGGRILAAVELRYRVPFRRDRPEALISAVAVPGGERGTVAVPVNDDGLVDVTELGLL